MRTVDAHTPGRFFPLDKHGNIINDTDAAYLPPGFAECVVGAFQRWFPDTLRAVYLRGSIARGTFVPGLSDLDAFAVLAEPARDVHPAADSALAAELLRLMPGLTELEFTTCQQHEVQGNYLGVWPFFIKTQSLLLYGEDYASQLRPYRPGVTIMGEALWLTQRLREYQQRLTQPEWRGKPGLLCEWIMKAVVRAAFELTMEQQRCYTRDLFLCCDVFSRHFPQQADWCRQAMRWAIQPDARLVDQQQLLALFCPWIAQQLQHQLQQYQVNPSAYQLAPLEESEK